MGEYATDSTGQSIKIGTCEDMYYLRADQARDVTPEAYSLDPWRMRHVIRFRFPFPDEDGTAPGAFGDPFRSMPVSGVEVPECVAHSSIHFTSSAGYVASLPCPESGQMPEGVDVRKHAFTGSVRIVQQKYVKTDAGDVLALVCQCACGAKWRLETLEEAQPIIDALRAMDRADARKPHGIAERIEAGYRTVDALTLADAYNPRGTDRLLAAIERA